MAAPESSVSPRRWRTESLQELYQTYWPLMRKTRAAATKSRKVMAGQGGITIPQSVQLAGADAWLGDLPHKRTNPLRVKNKILAKKLQVRRPITSAGYSAQSVSTRIEQPLDAIMRDRLAGFPDTEVVENLLFEGLCFSVVMMNLTNWQAHWPSLYVPGSESEFQARFKVDSKGNLEGDEGYSGIDMSRAERMRNAELHEAMARNIPFRQQAYSIRQSAPIWGRGLEL